MRLFWTIVWKEWLGLRWKLAALCAILLVPVVLCLIEFDARLLAESMIIIGMAYNAVAPIFMAMHVVAEDSSAGTLEFIRGLPIPLARLAMIRILATLAALVAPLALAAGVMYAAVLILPQWSPPLGLVGIGLGQAIAPTLVAMFVAASLLAWTTALSMNRPSELRVGIIGLVTAVAWGAWTLFSIAQWDNRPGDWRWLYGITALGPFGAAVLFDPGLTAGMRVAMAIGQLGALCTLIVFASRRYGILERPGARRGNLPGANAALWWMQWREAWPIGVAGLGTMLVLSIVSTSVSPGVRDSVLFFRSMVYLSSVFLGIVWAIVIATGLFSADLEPRLVSFWRSRPIDTAGWFRTKYLAGAIVLLVFIELPALPAALAGQPLEDSTEESLIAFLACVPVTHLAIYSMAVLIVCLVRQTIYSGILSLGAALFFIGLPPLLFKSETLSAFNFIQLADALPRAVGRAEVSAWLVHWAVYLICTLVMAVAATWLAFRAVQNDIAVRA